MQQQKKITLLQTFNESILNLIEVHKIEADMLELESIIDRIV